MSEIVLSEEAKERQLDCNRELARAVGGTVVDYLRAFLEIHYCINAPSARNIMDAILEEADDSSYHDSAGHYGELEMSILERRTASFALKLYSAQFPKSFITWRLRNL